MEPVKPGQRLEVEIEALDDAANGVVHVGDVRLRIPMAAPGDRVRVSVESVSRHRLEAWGRILELLHPGNSRCRLSCPMSVQEGGGCGGCPARHLRYDVALEMKRRAVTDALVDAGFDRTVSIEPSKRQDGYRNRAGFVAARTSKGGCCLGSYRPRSHRVAPMTGCPALRPPLALVHSDIEAAMNRLAVPVFPEPFGIRYVSLRANEPGDSLVELVVNGFSRQILSGLSDELMRIPGVVGVAASVNKSPGNALRVAPAEYLAGQTVVIDRFGQVTLPLSAGVFSQLNCEVAGQMYIAAAEALTDAQVIWDLYCGVGGLGLNALALNNRARLYGAESLEESIVLAGAAAENAGVSGRATFATADLSRGLPDWPPADAILVNPPRRGLDASVRQMLCDTESVSTLIYMSCGPQSFARDAAVLVGAGWRLNDVSAWDMLPGTAHVELLARFSR